MTRPTAALPPSAPEAGADTGRGLAYGLGAYFIWGILPLYFALLAPASGFEVVAARILFSVIFCVLIVAVTRGWADLRRVLAHGPSMRRLAIASILICVNWLTYVYAVLSHNSLEAALGYFINPIVPILLGVFILKERLRRAQWWAIALGAAAVVVLTVGYGKLPVVSLVLAVTFGLYGFAKKGLRPGTTAVASLTVETLLLAPLALVALVLPMLGIGTQLLGEPTLFTAGPAHFWIMACSGVITAVPLLLFGAAASRLPLSVVGMLQYVAPVMQFLVALLVFHEHMSPARWAGFGLIWAALAVLSADMVIHAGSARRMRRAAAKG